MPLKAITTNGRYTASKFETIKGFFGSNKWIPKGKGCRPIESNTLLLLVYQIKILFYFHLRVGF